MFSVDVTPSGVAAPSFQVADEIAVRMARARTNGIAGFVHGRASRYLSATCWIARFPRRWPIEMCCCCNGRRRSAWQSIAAGGRPRRCGNIQRTRGPTYDLIVIASAGIDLAGLYGVSVQGGPSDAVIYRSENTVGRLPRARTVDIASAGTYALTLTDLEFPEALTSMSAALIQNDTLVGSATGATPANLTVESAGSAQLIVYAVTSRLVPRQ